MTDVILETRNLKKSFGKLEVLKGISTQIRRGEVVSIIGPSGGGKSTFLRCLNLLETPEEGEILSVSFWAVWSLGKPASRTISMSLAPISTASSHAAPNRFIT